MKCSHSGIEVLLEEGVYEAAYPLHDQLIPKHDAGEPETWNDRMVSGQYVFLDEKHRLHCRNYIIVGRNLLIFFVFNPFELFVIIMANV